MQPFVVAAAGTATVGCGGTRARVKAAIIQAVREPTSEPRPAGTLNSKVATLIATLIVSFGS